MQRRQAELAGNVQLPAGQVGITSTLQAAPTSSVGPGPIAGLINGGLTNAMSGARLVGELGKQYVSGGKQIADGAIDAGLGLLGVGADLTGATVNTGSTLVRGGAGVALNAASSGATLTGNVAKGAASAALGLTSGALSIGEGAMRMGQGAVAGAANAAGLTVGLPRASGSGSLTLTAATA